MPKFLQVLHIVYVIFTSIKAAIDHLFSQNTNNNDKSKKALDNEN